MQVAWIAVFWILFAGTHMALSSDRFRPGLVARLGDRGFQGVYSLVALATFVPLVWSYYAAKHAGPFLWNLRPAESVIWVGEVLIGVAFVLLVAGLLQPSAAGMAGGTARVRGIARITRHPVFMGFGLWGLAHLLVTVVHASELVFFAGFAIFAVVGGDHQDARKRRASESYREFAGATPFFPFASLGAWRGLFEWPMPIAIAIGVALTLALRHYAHAFLAG